MRKRNMCNPTKASYARTLPSICRYIFLHLSSLYAFCFGCRAGSLYHERGQSDYDDVPIQRVDVYGGGNVLVLNVLCEFVHIYKFPQRKFLWPDVLKIIIKSKEYSE